MPGTYISPAETGLYYLESRYYNPEIGRFINADAALYQNILGYNMFAYCYNNPTNCFDPAGESVESIFWTWLIEGGLIAAAEPTFVGEIIYAAVTIVLGGVIVVGKTVTIINNVSNILRTRESSQSITKNQTSTDKVEDKDSRLKGDPGEVKREGYKETLIGQDGRATKERHWSNHGNPKKHSTPHDHNITWDSSGNPIFGPPQNYWDGAIPVFP